MTARSDRHAGNADVTRQRHSAVPAWFVGAFALALVFALVPMGVQCTEGGLHVHICEAHAVTPGNLGAKLLTKMAEAAGLPEGQLIATTAGVIGASTGMNLANSDGIEMGATAAHNLGALIDAADYPAWDTLDSETQTTWGTKYDYDAAKYCELLTGLGYGDLVTEFYSSGGGNFDPSDDEAERLQQLGRIGQNWANGAANTFGEIASMLTNKEAVNAYFGFSPSYDFDATSIDDWPGDVPRVLRLAYTSETLYSHKAGAYGQYTYYNNRSTNRAVYCFFIVHPGTSIIDEYVMFSNDAFTYGYAVSSSGWPAKPAMNSNSVSYSYQGSSIQVAIVQAGFKNDGFQANIPINTSSVSAATESIKRACAIMLRDGVQQTQLQPDITDYPQESEDGEPAIPDDTPIYYPADGKAGSDGQPGEPGGINPDTTWPEFITPPPEPEKPRPDNPYNPQNPDPDTGEPTTGTGTPEWREETEENVLPLLDIKFDQLFPFSMLFDISKMFEKVETATRPQSTSGVYNVVTIPFDWGGDSDQIVLDLAWLYDLLMMIRFFNQLLLAAFLLFTAIEFWRGILTG